MRLTKKLGIVAATAGIGVGAAIGIAQAGGDEPPPLWHPPTTDIAVPATAAAKAAYPILADSRRAASGGDTAQVATLAARAQIGVDADGARVIGSTDAGPIWLIPANRGLCLGLEDTDGAALGITCEDTDTVVARGTTIGDGTTTYGIVPDGATSVTVTSEDGTARAVDVDANGLYTLPSENATIAIDGADGRTEFDVAG